MNEEIDNPESVFETEPSRDTRLEDEPDPAGHDPIELNRQIGQLTAERDELKDRLLRKQAEFENFKKRTDRERAEFVKFASAELMREVLNVVDSFEIALSEDSSGDGEAQSVREGFELIYKQLVDSMKRFGLEFVEAKGHPFDPNLHQAVSTEPSDDVVEGIVIEDLRRGYLLNGKLLRPSMVTVAARPDSAGDDGQ